jgi:hypothetical protein
VTGSPTNEDGMARKNKLWGYKRLSLVVKNH